MDQTFEMLKPALADRYLLEREIGAGGMATVFLAHDPRHNRKVAIKVMHPDLAMLFGPDRFLKEIETTATCSIHISCRCSTQVRWLIPFST
jgi:serine/threonine-protein kinase